MRFIDFSTFTPSSTWNARALLAKEELMRCTDHDARIDYIKKHSSVWRDLKAELIAKFGSRCWFTDAEETVAQLDVEHFRPKSEAVERDESKYEGYWWLAFELSNLRLAGQIPNRQHKRCYFPLKAGSPRATNPSENWRNEEPLFLDPTKLTDFELVAYDEKGQMLPSAAAESDEEKDRVTLTDSLFGLSAHQPLVEARQRVWSDCRGIIAEINALKEEERTFGANGRTKAERERLMRELRKRTRPEEPFSVVAKCCIQMSGHDWAGKLIAA